MPIGNSGIDASTRRFATQRKSVGVSIRCARNTPNRIPPVTSIRAAMPASVRERWSRVNTSADTGTSRGDGVAQIAPEKLPIHSKYRTSTGRSS